MFIFKTHDTYSEGFCPEHGWDCGDFQLHLEAQREPDIEPEPKPTWSKPCERCGKTVERWRGEGDVSCMCGASYNSFGQLLRDDWRDNPSNYDDEISDLDGFEISQLRNEDY